MRNIKILNYLNKEFGYNGTREYLQVLNIKNYLNAYEVLVKYSDNGYMASGVYYVSKVVI